MFRIKAIAGGCLTILVVSMAVSATAQALPEWQKEGKSLTEALPFKSNGSTGQFQEGTVHVTWGSVGGKGSIKGSNELEKLSLIFWESKVTGVPGECSVHSPGAKAGEIKTKELKGSIGYIEKTGKIVGALAEPVSGTTVTEIEGTCLPSKVTVTGSVVGRVISELNTPVGSVNVKFGIHAGVQEYTHFENEEVEHVLLFSGGLTGPTLFECIKEQFELEGGKKVEIKA
jgi:hypothetical protein